MSEIEYIPLEDIPYAPITGNEQLSYEWNNWFSLLRNLQTHLSVFSETCGTGTAAANTTTEVTTTVESVLSGDIVLAINKPSHTAGLGIVGYRVSADDTITITYQNTTGSGIAIPAETYSIVTLRQ